MSADARPHLKPSKLALVLAAGTSAALGAAAFTGRDLGAVEVVGAFAIAGTIGAISIHHSRFPVREPHVLSAVRSSRGAAIAAPRAASYMAHPAHGAEASIAAARTDAA